MFTGLVEECGRVVGLHRRGHAADLVVEAPVVSQDARIGDSIAVNGCCLTVVRIEGNQLTFEAVPETLDRTTLGDLRAEAKINLERSLAVGARLGGHFVQGHIDGVGTITSVETVENAVVMSIETPSQLRRYLVEKGSVAVDGVSLTVASLTPVGFTIWTIPHTREVTTLGSRKPGDGVNLECDLLGKYVERLLETSLVPANIIPPR